jgi:hypothetical protein
LILLNSGCPKYLSVVEVFSTSSLSISIANSERELRKETLRGQFSINYNSGEVGDWWIETELQNRFHGQCEKESGILGSDDGMAGFSGWERNMGYGLGNGNQFIDNWIRAS